MGLSGKPYHKRQLDEVRTIARTTSYEGTQMFIESAISDELLARDKYFKDLIKDAIYYGFCIISQASNFFKRFMKRRMPQIQMMWQDKLEGLIPEIIAGSQLMTSEMQEDKRTGELINVHKCEKLQSKGIDIYVNPEKAKPICKQCGNFMNDIRHGTTTCPYSYAFVPYLFWDFGLNLEDDEIRGVEILQDPQRHMKENVDNFIDLIQERREILSSEWYTSQSRIMDIQKFRTSHPVGKIVRDTIQEPLIDLVKSIIELNRGCENYWRYLQPYIPLDATLKCNDLEDAHTIEEILEICEQCSRYKEDMRGCITCNEFYLSLENLRSGENA